MPSDQPDYADYAALADAELWKKLQSGISGALGELYDRHAPLVYGVSLKILTNPQEAEDLTQDIFVSLARQTSYDPHRGALRTFLMVLTRSRAIDRLRSRKSTQRLKQRWQADYVSPESSLSIASMANAERSEQVKSALSQLPQPQQQVLQLAYYEGLTQAAISEQLDTPLGTVKARARRGLLKLRKILQDDSSQQLDADSSTGNSTSSRRNSESG